MCSWESYRRAQIWMSFPSRSTDFEVHRNWLAITYSLPISKWYWDVSSCHADPIDRSSANPRPRSPNLFLDYIGMESVHKYLFLGVSTDALLVYLIPHLDLGYTALDYPPFFAYFEFLLSLPARLIDKHIVELSNLNYGGWSVIAYQRSTVIITELVLGAALIRCVAFASI